MNEPKVVEGIPVGTACIKAEVDWSPFIDCLQALVAGNRPKLYACTGVLAFRLVLGDIVKRDDCGNRPYEGAEPPTGECELAGEPSVEKQQEE